MRLHRATSVFTLVLLAFAMVASAACSFSCAGPATGSACCAHPSSDAACPETHASITHGSSCEHLPAVAEVLSTERPAHVVSLMLGADIDHVPSGAALSKASHIGSALDWERRSSGSPPQITPLRI